MIKKEQIEEMARIIDVEKDICGRIDCLQDCKTCKILNEEKGCLFGNHIAEELYNAGYRKIGKEYDVQNCDLLCWSCGYRIKAKLNKDTAKKILEKVGNIVIYEDDRDVYYLKDMKDFKDIAEEYGVEIEK